MVPGWQQTSNDIFVGGGPWGGQGRLRVELDGPLTDLITLPKPPKGHEPTGEPYDVTAVKPGTHGSTKYKRIGAVMGHRNTKW
jgi:hypothetical protein